MPECGVCRDIGFLRPQVPVGHPDFGRLVPCECGREEYAARKMARLAAISGMLEEELALDLDDVVANDRGTARMVAAAREFVANPSGFLTLWGGVGNGKTLILMAVSNETRRRGLVTAYVRFKDLIDYVRAGMEDGFGGDRERYDYLKAVDVLTIDEVDKARMTEYAWEFRTSFLDDRYRLAVARRAHTVFAMNCAPRDLPADIYDRLRDGRFQIIRNADASMRPAMEW